MPDISSESGSFSIRTIACMLSNLGNIPSIHESREVELGSFNMFLNYGIAEVLFNAMRDGHGGNPQGSVQFIRQYILNVFFKSR